MLNFLQIHIYTISTVFKVFNCYQSVIRVFNCYRPPCSNRNSDGIKCICIQFLYPINRTVIICGDFDSPNIDWSVDNYLKHSNLSCTSVFFKLWYNNHFKQFVNCPNRLDNLLDIVSWNKANCIVHTRVTSPLVPKTTNI